MPEFPPQPWHNGLTESQKQVLDVELASAWNRGYLEGYADALDTLRDVLPKFKDAGLAEIARREKGTDNAKDH